MITRQTDKKVDRVINIHKVVWVYVNWILGLKIFNQKKSKSIFAGRILDRANFEASKLLSVVYWARCCVGDLEFSSL